MVGSRAGETGAATETFASDPSFLIPIDVFITLRNVSQEPLSFGWDMDVPVATSSVEPIALRIILREPDRSDRKGGGACEHGSE